jgi:hypothetical protein
LVPAGVKPLGLAMLPFNTFNSSDCLISSVPSTGALAVANATFGKSRVKVLFSSSVNMILYF